MEIPFRSDYPPRHDVVFSIIFGHRDMFAALLKAVTGHELKTDIVYSQANMTPDNVEHNYIRFDTFSMDNDVLYSLDLQNSYVEELVKNRTIYYACRSVSGQTITKGRYDDLKRVIVSFIMTGKDNGRPVEIIKLRDEDNNVYSELLALYNVYVPAVNKCNDSNVDGSLKIFAAFFSVKNEDSMKSFIESYSEKTLGAKLIYYYSEAIKMNNLDIINREEYFDMKITEEDINEAKKEARIEGLREGREEGREQGREEGREEGREKGRLEEKVSIIKKLLAAGFSKADLIKALGPDVNGIDSLLSAST